MSDGVGYHDEDEHFEPFPSPLSLSQQLRPGKRKRVQVTNELCKTPISNASRCLPGPHTMFSELLPFAKLPRPYLASTQKRASDNLPSACHPTSSIVGSTSIAPAWSGNDAFVLSRFKNHGEINISTIQNDKLVSCLQATPDGGRSAWKFHVPESSNSANSLRIGTRLQEEYSAGVPLTARFNGEESTSAGTQRAETFFKAADWWASLGNDIISEGLVRALTKHPSDHGSTKRLCKSVDGILDDNTEKGYIPAIEIDSATRGMKFHDGHIREDCLNTLSTGTSTRGAWRASNGYIISKSFPEKSEDLRKTFGRTVRNKTETSESRGATYDHDAISKGEIWDEEFAAFANRKPTQSSTTTANVPAALVALQAVASKGQILHVETIPARPPAYTNYHFKLQEKLHKALQERGVKRFYTHQVKAMDLVFNGSSIVAATPTASGKSMTYIVPVLNSLIKNSNSRALFIFPCKALARDQLKILSGLVAEVKKGSHCYCYDGDTEMDKRPLIRKTAKIVLTTPDMLHVGILPNHKLWEKFFSDLRFVVVDEAHSYGGIFGSHVGCVLRRLLRISRFYDSKPMFICCSATMTNPKEHVKKLTTIDMEVIHGSGAPAGEKHVMCWLPPETMNGGQRSDYKDTAKIVVALMKEDLQILVFVEDRKSSEIVCKMVRQKLAKEKRFDLVNKVDSYRAGYTQVERISLEKRLQDGQLRALVTTRALELGIDVGSLDATVHVGLPDTMCSLWQQAGRAGRKQGPSLAVIVGRGRELDVFYMKNPQKLFSRDVEQAVCNPTNPHLLRLHLRCAANEIPLCGDDVQYFGENYKKIRDELLSEGILQYRTDPTGNSLYGYRYDDNPASEIAIRGIFGNNFQLLTGNNEVVEEVDEKMALRVLYEGAIYRHASDTYRIKYLDFEKKKAFGELYELHHMTVANVKTKVQILEKIASRATLGTRIHLGKLEVIEQAMGYSEYDVTKHKQIDTVALNYPPSVFRTVGLWWDFPAEVMQKLKHMAYEALLVLKRVLLPLLAAMTMSSTTDMFGLETLGHEQTEQPEIFFYDAYDGGIGLAEQAYKDVEQAWRQALNVLQTCDCRFGCPACTRSASGNVDNEANSSKHATILLLECLLCTKQQASVHANMVNHTTAEPRINIKGSGTKPPRF